MQHFFQKFINASNLTGTIYIIFKHRVAARKNDVLFILFSVFHVD
jgi:hypothetical protein